MKRRLLQQSLDLATEIHQLMKQVPGDDVAALSELEEKLLETVKLRKLRKMTINPTLARINDLKAEIEVVEKQVVR